MGTDRSSDLPILQPGDQLLALLSNLSESPDPASDSGKISSSRTRPGRAALALVAHPTASDGGAESGGEDSAPSETAVLVLRDGLVDRVLPVVQGSRVDIEQIAANAQAGQFRIVLYSPDMEGFAFQADLLSRPVTDFLAALKAAQKVVNLPESAPADGGQSYEWATAYVRRAGEGTGVCSSDKARGAGTRASSSISYLTTSSLPPTSPLAPSPDPFSRPFDPSDAHEDYTAEERAATERWLAERLREREDEFLQKEEIRLWCGTFNVNDKQPKGAEDVQAWVDSCDGAELLVFGFQELDLSTEAMIRYTPYREEVWRRALEEALAKRFSEVAYTKLHSRQLVGALTLVYVREDVREHVRDVSSASLATGLMGMLANKGAVGIRLRYRDAPLTFVNSHLAAFVQNVAQRNGQFRDTAAQLVFPCANADDRDAWVPNLRREAGKVGEGWSVWESEVLVWLGDLNYRLDLPRADVDRMVESKEYGLLLHFDQLSIQQQQGAAFQGFHEAPITFAPSFKFDNGTQDYDTSDKQRVPSWTDRILYLAQREDSVRAVERYTSHPEVTISDHKPVSAMLTVSVYDLLHDRRKEVHQEIVAELDQFDNDAMPDIKLSPGPSVEFDAIRYNEPVSREIEVVNVGSVIAPWSFVIKPGDTTLSRPWLTVSPTSGPVLPSTRQTVTLTIHVTSSTGAGAFSFPVSENAGEIVDLLVLSVRGKDLFLSISARDWMPTVFGARLPHLVRLSEPIRATSLARRVAISQAVAADEAGEKLDAEEIPRSAVPLALHRLVGFLAEHALDVPGLFGTPGDAELVDLARECLDTGDDFPRDRFLPSTAPSTHEDHLEPAQTEVADAVAALDALEADIGSIALSSPALDARPPSPPFFPASSGSAEGEDEGEDEGEADHLGVHSLADCALLLLESLAEPVVCWSAYERALRCEDRDEAYRVVRDLPEAHANTLLYILAFLRVLLNQTKDPQERAGRRDRLAVIFSTVLLRAPPSPPSTSRQPASVASTSIDPATVPRRRKTFVWLLLSDQEEVGPNAGTRR